MPIVRRHALQALTALLLAFSAAPIRADDFKQYACMNACELESLFRSGTAASVPCGDWRGKPLLMLDAKNPRTRAAMTAMLWKGKRFLPCGKMVNQWVGIRAIKSDVSIAPSSLDGQPCIRLDYAPNAPIFGNAFDEIREIAPGVLLGCYFEKCPAPRLKGFFVLVQECR